MKAFPHFFFFFGAAMLCAKQKGQKEDLASLCRNLRLRTVQRVEFVFSMRVEGGVELF